MDVDTDNKEQAEQLYADFMEWRLMDDPEYGTSNGIHTYDHLVSQWTEEAFVNRVVCNYTIITILDFGYRSYTGYGSLE